MKKLIFLLCTMALSISTFSQTKSYAQRINEARARISSDLNKSSFDLHEWKKAMDQSVMRIHTIGETMRQKIISPDEYDKALLQEIIHINSIRETRLQNKLFFDGDNEKYKDKIKEELPEWELKYEFAEREINNYVRWSEVREADLRAEIEAEKTALKEEIRKEAEELVEREMNNYDKDLQVQETESKEAMQQKIMRTNALGEAFRMLIEGAGAIGGATIQQRSINSWEQAVNPATTIYPTLPGTDIQDLNRPGYIIERENIYPTVPGTDIRDYGKPGAIRQGNIIYQTLPGTNIRDYSKPGYKIK